MQAPQTPLPSHAGCSFWPSEHLYGCTELLAAALIPLGRPDSHGPITGRPTQCEQGQNPDKSTRRGPRRYLLVTMDMDNERGVVTMLIRATLASLVGCQHLPGGAVPNG